MAEALHQYLEGAVRRFPDRIAVVDPSGREISYSDLGTVTNRLRDRLRELGVGPGDRVAIYLWKSIDSIVSIYGILKTGAAYVPLDPNVPASRNAFIVTNCSVAVLIIDRTFVAALKENLGVEADAVSTIVLEEPGAPTRFDMARSAGVDEEISAPTHESRGPDLAYILYTSGSTGKPKGVMLSHQNAVSYVDWCSDTFSPSEQDRFSSHAPLHFDLSILDVHVSLKHGATLILISEQVGKDPQRLAKFIAESQITIWYSTPSILGLLAEFGQLEKYDYSPLRLVLFAGEVFPIKHLRTTLRLLPDPGYFNLYGPTETNVCTYYELPMQIPEDRTAPYPIGRTCSHYTDMVIDEKGIEVEAGREGELLMRGPAVTLGYWKLPAKTSQAFFEDSRGDSWYRTGDIVIEDDNGDYIFLGRRDRMVKKRGYRIELGEIENCLYGHDLVEEAGVIAVRDNDGDLRIDAYLSVRDGERLSVVALKSFCAKRLPNYMIPDRFVVLDKLPRTSTDKVNYQGLSLRSA